MSLHKKQGLFDRGTWCLARRAWIGWKRPSNLCFNVFKNIYGHLVIILAFWPLIVAFQVELFLTRHAVPAKENMLLVRVQMFHSFFWLSNSFLAERRKEGCQILTLPSLSIILCGRFVHEDRISIGHREVCPHLPKPTHGRNFAQSLHNIKLKHMKKGFCCFLIETQSLCHQRRDMTLCCSKIFQFGAAEVQFRSGDPVLSTWSELEHTPPLKFLRIQ